MMSETPRPIRPARGASLLALLGVLVLASSVPAFPPPACRPEGRYVMGTVLEMDLCGDVAASVYDDAFAVARSLDAELTTWADDSAVLRLNRASGVPTEVPPSLHALLSEAIRYDGATGGAFDVSVGPLLSVWRDAERRDTVPSPESLAAARARVGSTDIEMRPDGTVRLPPGMALDLGGIGKGFALDRIAARLRAAGVRSGLLDFGQSSLVALGAPPDAPAWNLWLRRTDGPIVGVVSLRDVAASTSATFGHVVSIDGHPYSHVVDPRSGRPVARERLAFVIAPKASLAEAYSTALIVLGRSGLALLERQDGVEGLFLEEGSDEIWRTSGFDRATGFRRS